MKMGNPTLEVVRLRVEDVIATSGLLRPMNGEYAALYSEAVQAGVSPIVGTRDFVKLEFSAGSVTGATAMEGLNDDLSLCYTWYNEGIAQWQTEEETPDYYYNNPKSKLDYGSPDGWRDE